jgi:hypothetical protein
MSQVTGLAKFGTTTEFFKHPLERRSRTSFKILSTNKETKIQTCKLAA